MTPDDPLIAALQPLVSRVRTDVTAIKKADGRQAWTREPLTPERLAKHLNGGPARGVSQIRAGQSVTMVGLLDFDSHRGETGWFTMLAAAREVMDSLVLLGGSPIAFRSSGGKGIHVYLLWDDPQDAYSVREWLKVALRASGYIAGTRGVKAGEIEVFPKQDSVPADGFGNQVVLPLAGASVPLLWDAEMDDWRIGVREDAVGMRWGLSAPVPVLQRPARAVAGAVDFPGAAELRELLTAIPNSGDKELGYDDWRSVVFAVHHETGGSDAGLALVHELSSRSGKYDPGFLDSRVWPYVDAYIRPAMEGLGVPFTVIERAEYATKDFWGGEDGKTILWLVSDDNFNRWQRSLLLKFELVDLPPRK